VLTNIGIIGVGGVGGFVGGKLCHHLSAKPGNAPNLYFLARGQHLEAIKRNGLLLQTADAGEFLCRPTLAADNPKELPVLDLVFICVKGFDLKKVVSDLPDQVTADSLIIPLLNGIDIYDRIREIITIGTVFPACVYVTANITRPGTVTQPGGGCKILFGKDPQLPAVIPHEVFKLLSDSQLPYQWLENPFPAIWTKFMFIAPYALVTACFNKTFGEVLESKTLSDHVRCIMAEISALAQAKGIPLPDTIIEDSFAKGKNFYNAKTSFQRDFAQMDKADERDSFGGVILRLGQALGIPTPCTGSIYDQLNRAKPL
jgi:2-dehydropantoate 2-reductase